MKINLSQFIHILKKDGVCVKKGEKVKKGQVIGQTGNSGWIGRTPHLHFSLFK